MAKPSHFAYAFMHCVVVVSQANAFYGNDVAGTDSERLLREDEMPSSVAAFEREAVVVACHGDGASVAELADMLRRLRLQRHPVWCANG